MSFAFFDADSALNFLPILALAIVAWGRRCLGPQKVSQSITISPSRANRAAVITPALKLIPAVDAESRQTV